MYKKGYVENMDKITKRMYHNGRFNTIKKAQSKIKKIKKLEVKNYKTLDFSSGKNIIYCDPPYNQTMNVYNKNCTFDTEEFWKIANKWKEEGNYVYVSEKQCPLENVEIIFSKNIFNSISKNTKVIQEKLYKII